MIVKKILSGFAAILLSSTASIAQEKKFSEYDMSGDGKLSYDEFDDVIRNTGWHSAWDINDNYSLNIEEWEQGLEKMYPEKDLFSKKRYREWDQDADGFISDEDFRYGMYKLWDDDGDKYISREEFSKWRYRGEMDDKSRAYEKK